MQPPSAFPVTLQTTFSYRIQANNCFQTDLFLQSQTRSTSPKMLQTFAPNSQKCLAPQTRHFDQFAEPIQRCNFTISQFHLDGYSMPYRLDRNRNGGGVIIYVREDIPSNILRKHFFPNDIEGIFVEINFRKSKWLLCSTYHPPSQSDQYYFDNIDKALDVYCQYEKKRGSKGEPMATPSICL